ncbi:FAD:protein FMN transferase [Sphingomonas sp. 35-24ZXX]|uniref:FAD:protein FMN transferase n=1 Tax=Sphingomonas sp. 35-24ZXX TaxID=1545915 RepID=UPI000A7E5816|nr:FAD:protein FMN transferase [Sphingomonas sp. 35-24ZXX]
MSQPGRPPRIAVPDAVDPAVFRSFDAGAPVVRLAGETMGTTWGVHVAVPRSAGLGAPQLQAKVQVRLDGIVADMSHWEPGSQLSRFNRADGGTRLELSQDFAAVMAAALSIASASGGAFDPAVGRLTDLWGLGPRRTTDDPDQCEIDAALAQAGWRRLAFDARSRSLFQPGGVWLDLSGIAKGFAVDAIADLLARHGLHHALVEIGGECAGRGLRPDGDPWWVDLEDPPGVRLPPLRIALHQLSVATSGDYLRGGHTLDPATGRPAIHRTTAVSVLHPSCMLADAWATALSVLDDAAAQALACRHGLIARIVRRDGREWLSPALTRMVDPDAAAA